MKFIDPFGRAITYLRISLTDHCNLRCVYCMPKEGMQWQPRADQLSAEEIARVVETAAQGGVKRVRLTGGEPLVHPQVVDIVRRIASIPNIEEISLTTNAMLLVVGLLGALIGSQLGAVRFSGAGVRRALGITLCIAVVTFWFNI